MRLSNLLFPLFVFVILLQPSCTKNETDNYAKENSSYIPLIKNSGYTNVLTFPNDSVFYETLSYLAEKDSAFIAGWCSARNFQSMRQIVDEIVRDEEQIARRYEDMTQHELDSVSQLPIEHSPLVQSYPHLILTRETDDGGAFFDWNVHDFAFANLLNHEGVVVIDTTIVQYDYDYKRVILDGDFAKIPLLKGMKESDERLNIAVKKLRGHNSFTRSCEETTQNNKIKLLVYEDFVQNHNEEQNIGFYTTTTYTIKLRSLKRRFWGLWWDNHQTSMKVAGSIEGNAGWGFAPWGAQLYFDLVGIGYSFPYPLQEAHTLVYPIGIGFEGIVTENEEPTVYSSTHTGQLTKSGQNPSQNCFGLPLILDYVQK